MEFYFLLVLMIFRLSSIKAQINLGRNGTASQKSTYDTQFKAENAVVKDRGECSITGGDRARENETWWRLTFPVDTVYVTDIKIYFRSLSHDDEYRFKGFSLYISNSTDNYTGQFCFGDPGTEEKPSNIQNGECNEMGKYLTVFNERPQRTDYVYIEICYMKIHGCYKSFFGENCRDTCSPKCIDRHCNPNTGICIWGCNCLDNICDGNPKCEEGCEKRFAGEYCSKYNLASGGKAALNNTNKNQQAQIGIDGNKTFGSCIAAYGLNAWWQVDLKGVSAVTAVYITYQNDDTVKNRADNHKLFILTTLTDGQLIEEIQLNMTSDFNRDFPLIRYEIADFIVGQYIKYVPKPTETGTAFIDVCEVEVVGCPSRYYGPNCNKTCPENCFKSCHPDTGQCSIGCNAGWYNDHNVTCSKACDNGTFGNCTTKCHCRYGSCDKATGICPDKQCDKGWTGETCSLECQHRYFGFNCKSYCGGCYNSSCERLVGNCTYGCIDGFEGPRCLRQSIASTDAGVIGGGIGATIAVFILVIIVIIIIRRKRMPDNRPNYNREQNAAKTTEENICPNKPRTSALSSDNLSFSLNHNDNDQTMESQPTYVNDQHLLQDDLYNNVPTRENRSRIHIEDLKNVFNEKKMNEGDGFRKEFACLPTGRMHPHIEGSKEENKIKNRFLTTWPYDHSRVILYDNGTSDYINANYIDSYTQEKAYIAAQGPKKNTIQDFWHLVWQENVEIIVMLTGLVEVGRKKCDQYWPETLGHTMMAGPYTISLVKEIVHTVYVHRLIKFSNREAGCCNNVEEHTERTVHHFHFMQWPDHGVPDTIKLVDFYRKVASTKHPLNGPWVVHCSAGIGRTGTFIAIDAVNKYGRTSGYVDIMEYVEMMRKDRMNMIQTKEQYQSVFEALLELFTVPDKSIERSSFCDYLRTSENNIAPKNQNSLKVEFQKLQDLKPICSNECYGNANSRENVSKNVTKDILPHDSFRPYLMNFEKSRNNYINAVIVQGYSDKGNFITTQYPLQETVVDFWTMVYDHDCTAVVVLESERQDIPLLLKKTGTLDFDKLSLRHGSDSSVLPMTLMLQNKEKNDDRTIGVISMSDWNTENVPNSNKGMIESLEKLKSWRQLHSGSVVVVCHDGCNRSGLFVALSLIIEKMEMDDVVDIFQVVRMLQIRRPEFFATFDQYKYCYHCIKEYLDESSIYANA